MMQTPVVFIIFKRPDSTEKVFEAIRQAKPQKLFIVADGPRSDRPEEIEKCKTARSIIEQIDWDCEVLKNYSDINLGCGKRVYTGLDWVFEQVEEAIILEDDCLPHPTFFRFCEELLDRYRFDERIGSVSGQNVQFGRQTTEYSYYFSRYNHVWGWATWKRAWKDFDWDMNLWTEIIERDFLTNILGNHQAVKAWTKVFQDLYDGHKYTWDFQWQFACWVHNRLGIISNVNLISNIGFGPEGTNITNTKSKYANMPTQEIEFPQKHPPYMISDRQADIFTQNTLFLHLYSSILQRFVWKIQKKIGIAI